VLKTANEKRAGPQNHSLPAWALGNWQGIGWKTGQIEETVSPKADRMILTISAYFLTYKAK
jgi:hypothetical protein